MTFRKGWISWFIVIAGFRIVWIVYHTVSYATKDEWDTSDDDSLTATADENDPDMNDFYQRVVSSDDEDYFDSNNGSIMDFDCSMSEGEYCVVSDDGSVADLDWDMLENEDYGDSDVWSVTDLSGVDEEDDCDLNMISIADREMNISSRRVCLLCPDGMADLRILRDESVDGHRMDHSEGVGWDPGIADSQTLSVCYDCLCLMTLFRTVMYLAHYWAERIVWTEPDEWSGRSMAWREQYLPRLYPPCGRSVTCCYDGVRMSAVFRILLMLTGCSVCVGGSVDC